MPDNRAVGLFLVASRRLLSQQRDHVELVERREERGRLALQRSREPQHRDEVGYARAAFDFADAALRYTEAPGEIVRIVRALAFKRLDRLLEAGERALRVVDLARRASLSAATQNRQVTPNDGRMPITLSVTGVAVA